MFSKREDVVRGDGWGRTHRKRVTFCPHHRALSPSSHLQLRLRTCYPFLERILSSHTSGAERCMSIGHLWLDCTAYCPLLLTHAVDWVDDSNSGVFLYFELLNISVAGVWFEAQQSRGGQGLVDGSLGGHLGGLKWVVLCSLHSRKPGLISK